jgi:hypothetical protein
MLRRLAAAGGLLQRLALGLGAVALLVALALQLHWARLESAGHDLASRRGLDPGGLARARRDFERVRAHSPGTDALVAEGELALFHDRPREGLAPLLAAARAEPKNALAWQLIAQAADGIDDQLAARAGAQLDRLKPPPGRRPGR